MARRHAVNANQVFYWRKKYREGRLGKGPSSRLLPVTLSDSTCGKSASSSPAIGSLEIKLSKGDGSCSRARGLGGVAYGHRVFAGMIRAARRRRASGLPQELRIYVEDLLV